MHIVIFNINRLVRYKGGMSKCFSEISNLLVDIGYDVSAICFDEEQGEPGFPLKQNVVFINACDGVKSRIFSLLKNLKSLHFSRAKRHANRDLIELARIQERVEGVLKRIHKVDLFISFQPEATYILSKILEYEKRQIPIITMLHSNPKEVLGKPVFNYIRDQVSRSSAIQVLQPEFAQQVKEFFPATKIRVIPNFVAEQFKKINYSEKKIICVSRVVPGKRIDLLIDAFELIRDRFPGWVVEVYGELSRNPDYVGKIKRMILERKVGKEFILRGVTNDIPGVISKASIFAFPSSFEGFPISLLEAMKAGLPAVGCKDCTGVNTLIVDGRTGYLSEPSAPSFAKALEQLMSSIDLRQTFGGQSQKEAEKYSRENVGEAWNQLIKSVIN